MTRAEARINALIEARTHYVERDKDNAWQIYYERYQELVAALMAGKAG